MSLQFKDKTRNGYYVDRVTILDFFAAPSIVRERGNMLLMGNSGSHQFYFLFSFCSLILSEKSDTEYN